ncbi:hypothetical protein [cf. Phormidesmis sp. LEGE 11477]|uniref:hypothetical protein n=1 Tax=cf. Phormidesmis sp. LEGE 11477 TaxID=1828680 RepID=UPI00187E44AB|nr:hypothetical protein [cf. Phormidesmis sp. LEGE 11477]MBE9060873.1 hypothetical protein [cf. Phormidesmis sp. LEGE 11477]
MADSSEPQGENTPTEERLEIESQLLRDYLADMEEHMSAQAERCRIEMRELESQWNARLAAAAKRTSSSINAGALTQVSTTYAIPQSKRKGWISDIFDFPSFLLASLNGENRLARNRQLQKKYIEFLPESIARFETRIQQRQSESAKLREDTQDMLSSLAKIVAEL